MRDLFILGFLAFLILVSFKRPWMMTLAYIYVDLFQPQRVTYYLLNAAPVSLIFAIGAVVFFFFERNKSLYFSKIQGLMLALLLWTTLTTFMAMLPEHAWFKWDATWKAIGFGIFLPLVINTRQRLDGALFVIVGCVAALTISGGIKTVLGGGGYGTLKLIVDRNSGLYESSTIATVAITTIPLVVYLYKYSDFFPRNLLTKLFVAGLIFANLLIPVGTEARTGLICIVVLVLLQIMQAKRKFLVAGGVAAVALAAIPLLPSSFTDRMSTIEAHDQDQSAATRLAVWAWTWDFVQEHPFGGGFGAYRLNTGLTVETKAIRGPEGAEKVTTVKKTYQGARAYHSSYFEVLGEHGYPGIAIFGALIGTTLVSLYKTYRRLRKIGEDGEQLAALAKALFSAFLIFLAGALFVGIAFQTTLYLLLGISVAVIRLASIKLKSKEEQRAEMGGGLAARPAL